MGRRLFLPLASLLVVLVCSEGSENAEILNLGSEVDQESGEEGVKALPHFDMFFMLYMLSSHVPSM